MGVAAYNRGSIAISNQINQDAKPKRTAAEKVFAAGLEQGRGESDNEIARLRAEVTRGQIAFQRMQATVTYERKRRENIITRLRDFRESFRGKGPSQKAWAAIIALGRAEKE